MNVFDIFDSKWTKYIIVTIIIGTMFLSGFVVGKFKIPPYGLISKTYYQTIQLTNQYLYETEVTTLGKDKEGFWRRMRDRQKGDRMRQAEKGRVQGLQGLGYLSGTQEAPDQTGVILHNESKVSRGYNLIISGHAPEAVLMTNQGEIVHRWKVPWDKAFPDHPEPVSEKGNRGDKDYWRKAYLYPNGDMLVIYTYLGVAKIDKDSNVLWSKRNGAHHSVRVGETGKIYLLTAKSHIVPEINKKKPVVEDFLTVLSPEGKRLNQFSLLDAVVDSQYSSMMNFTGSAGDLLHTNSLQILNNAPEELKPSFEDGNILISQRENDCLSVVDLPDNKVVWSLCGMSTAQHAAKLLENGHLIFFDNIGHRGWSKVVELDPLNQKIVWGYFGNDENGFVTQCCGENHRLENGNTLIVESEPGRALEVTSEGEIVWEFYSPYRTGKENELVATLFDVIRYKPGYVNSWLNS